MQNDIEFKGEFDFYSKLVFSLTQKQKLKKYTYTKFMPYHMQHHSRWPIPLS